MKDLLHRIRKYLNHIGESGVNLENIGFAVTATVLVSAIVVTSGGGIVNDTEEKAHLLNAKGLISAVEGIAREARLAAGSTTTFTLAELQELGRIDSTIDPSLGTEYGSNSSVTVSSAFSAGYANPEYTFDVILTNATGDWVYLDTSISGGEVKIPARHDAGISPL